MGSLERRLKNLEAASEAGSTPDVQDSAVRRAALGRMTYEELEAYEGAAARHEAGENPTAADREIVAQAWDQYQEVPREFAQKA